MSNLRTWGEPPYSVAVIHGGPGAPGSVGPLARELSKFAGVLEPFQTEKTLDSQIVELKDVLEKDATLPAILIGHSWGAWLAYFVAGRYPSMVFSSHIFVLHDFHTGNILLVSCARSAIGSRHLAYKGVLPQVQELNKVRQFSVEREAACIICYKTVPVVFVDLSLEKARLLNLALNRISGSWDQELLGRLLAELNTAPGVDISLAGFEDDELKNLLKSLDLRDKRERLESFDLDEALKAAQAKPVASRGDVWLLGDHRVMCGNSTSAEDVARLMNGEKASLMATDPPYLVDYTASNHP